MGSKIKCIRHIVISQDESANKINAWSLGDTGRKKKCRDNEIALII